MNMTFYVTANGNDTWCGTRIRHEKGTSNGPWATPAGALRVLADFRRRGLLTGPVTVWVGGGRYELDQPLLVKPENEWPITFRARPGETPVFSGGSRITGWKREQLRGKPVWVADLPRVREGKWEFRSLFVDGKRVLRPRLPRKGLFRMAAVPGLTVPAGWGNGGQTVFESAPGDAAPFRNLADVEAVYLHFWIEERSPLAAFDPATRLVTLSRPSCTAMVASHGSQLADYYFDNVFEALDEPGQWYLDRSAGRLYYRPRPGDNPRTTEVIAPRLLQLLAFEGQPDKGAYVEQVRFDSITFSHTDWRHPAADGAVIHAHTRMNRHSRGNKAGASQAACDVPGAIAFEGARHCGLVNCTLSNLGWYGVSIADACEDIQVNGCTIRDTGAGGVKINGAEARDPDVVRLKTGVHAITDNTICEGGRIFHSAVGVLSMNAYHVTIAHNHIFDYFYTGISCGWEWGYHQSVSHSNTIAFNHIHDIGQGLLSDMGGIYTLGVQPGTVIRNNLIHDVRSAHYGGWCLYPDEGSSHLLIENNVCHDADREAFHQHYGRENMVVNNVFAFGKDATVCYSRGEAHNGLTFLRNLFISAGVPQIQGGYNIAFDGGCIRSDSNLFFDVTGRPPRFSRRKKEPVSFKDWKAAGYDAHSVSADPLFRNWKKRDFTLSPKSPALALGFKPIDMSRVGPRPLNRRGPVDGKEPIQLGINL
jgi:hypothetical protein